ncbi:hypothetical protein HY745_04325 [Candidatus Desantisbacteria bacterium]|nr:hypothetical protein [Candidatus Desantisbacteria bacterium]
MEKVTAGLDIGTSSIKLVLYGRKGIIYSDRKDYSGTGSSGQEIDPAKLFKDVISLICKANNRKVKIEAIGLSTIFPSLIVLDEKGSPLTNIITWMDKRGCEIAENFKKNKKQAAILQNKTGCIIHESYSLWKILWLKENKKEIFSGANKFLSLSDYLVYKLTGKYLVSYAIASTTGLFNIKSLKWDKEILKIAGISKDQLSECFSIFHSEELLEKIRLETRLDTDVSLVIGAGDGHLSNVGIGCLTDKTMCSTIGTSAALRIISPYRKHNKSVWKYYLYENKYIFGIAINAGVRTLDWFCKNILHKDSSSLFEDIDNIDLDVLTDIIVLPFLDGERGPNYNYRMSASLIGLNSGNSNSDIYKAAVEGILFNLYDCYRILVIHRKAYREIIATGGYVHTEKILQMQSDIFNIIIKVPCIKEASAAGAAIVALVSIGKIKSLSDIKIKFEKVYSPDIKRHKEYMKKYRRYRKLYKTLSKTASY